MQNHHNIDIAAIRRLKFQENIDLFICPICKGEMTYNKSNSLVCLDNHCFDIAKKGYINLLLSSTKTDYNKEMLESRRNICEKGFFKPMVDKISELVTQKFSDEVGENIKILDAGCGEGSHLADILKNLQDKKGFNFQGIGIDISKDAIQIAAKNHPSIIWCVADLARIPIKESGINAIINILSPSNYNEFKRILVEDGLLIKVVPGNNYLQELRSLFFKQTGKETYSNEKVINHFAENFNVLDVHEVTSNFNVGPDDFEHVIKMTPLTWGVPEEKIKLAQNTRINKVTTDLTIIVGKIRI